MSNECKRRKETVRLRASPVFGEVNPTVGVSWTGSQYLLTIVLGHRSSDTGVFLLLRRGKCIFLVTWVPELKVQVWSPVRGRPIY